MIDGKVELLLPAGNMEKLKTAFLYGADAVYLGGPLLGLRAKAGNFSLDGMEEAVSYAHALGKKIYVTMNIYAQNADLHYAEEYLVSLREIRPDALIISDMGLMRMAKRIAPAIPIHVSTQANTTNYESCLFYEDFGVQCVVMAREVSLQEIKEIKNHCQIDLEVFIHGAMCMAYSGRCMLSMFMTNRSANRGECTHPCRWKYHVVEEKRPGEFMPIDEDERGTYIFNSKDLCTVHEIGQLIEAGVSSLKIEGRMKSEHYIATVCKAYRRAIDTYYEDRNHYEVPSSSIRELKVISDRDYCTGFLFGNPTGDDHNYGDYNLERQIKFCAKVLHYDPQKKRLFLEQRNRFFIGDTLEILQIDGENQSFVVAKMWNEQDEPIMVCPHPKQKLSISYEHFVPAGTLIRVYSEE